MGKEEIQEGKDRELKDVDVEGGGEEQIPERGDPRRGASLGKPGMRRMPGGRRRI